MNRLPLTSRIRIACFILLSVSAGCQSARTVFDYDDQVDFGRYQTFSWISENPLSFHEMDSHTSTLLEQQLIEAAQKNLAGKGLRFVENPTDADLLVSFTVGSRERIIARDYYDPHLDSYYGSYNYGGRSYWADNSQLLRVTREGQVCVDVFDRELERPVWHGTSLEKIKTPDMQYWRDNVDRIVTLIIAGYPTIANG